MKVALDSNVLAYFAEVDNGPGDNEKIAQAQHVINVLRDKVILIVPTQVFGELYTLMVKGGRSRPMVRDVIMIFSTQFEAISASSSTFIAALDLAVDHKLQFWDSLIVSTAAEAGCTLFLSEDMQDGFTTRGMTIANPFLAKTQPALTRLLDV